MKDDYEKFDEQFGKRLRLGNYEDSTYLLNNVCGIVALRRPKSGDELIRPAECVGRKKERQNDIYCVADASVVVVSSSPCSGG